MQQQQQKQPNQVIDMSGLVKPSKTSPSTTTFKEDDESFEEESPSPSVPMKDTTARSLSDIQFSMSLTGESLDIIRKDEYLWNHFCLLMFFARTLIGTALTDEQK